MGSYFPDHTPLPWTARDVPLKVSKLEGSFQNLQPGWRFFATQAAHQNQLGNVGSTQPYPKPTKKKKNNRIPEDLGTGDFSKLMSAQDVGRHGYNSTPSCYRGDCSQEGPDLLREVNTQPSQQQTLLCKLHTIPGGL